MGTPLTVQLMLLPGNGSDLHTRVKGWPSWTAVSTGRTVMIGAAVWGGGGVERCEGEIGEREMR